MWKRHGWVLIKATQKRAEQFSVQAAWSWEPWPPIGGKKENRWERVMPVPSVWRTDFVCFWKLEFLFPDPMAHSKHTQQHASPLTLDQVLCEILQMVRWLNHHCCSQVPGSLAQETDREQERLRNMTCRWNKDNQNLSTSGLSRGPEQKRWLSLIQLLRARVKIQSAIGISKQSRGCLLKAKISQGFHQAERSGMEF